MSTPENLVYIDTYGLRGSNFYWHKYETHGLTKDDIMGAGVTSDRVQVDEVMVPALLAADAELRKKGWCMYIKEGYRSEALYEIVYKRRVEKYGKEVTDSILNLAEKPHALGLSVDVALWDVASEKEIYMRNGADGVEALFIGFYRGKTDEDSVRYQELQDSLAQIMQEKGFRIGKKREYFHFDYRPELPANYDI